MNISQKGLDLIKSFEGFSSTPYKDSGGKLSVGYGHLVRPSENFDNGLTEEQAQDLLAKDISYAESAVTQAVSVDLTQNEFDALISFTYNLGGKTLLNSTLLKKLNNGDFSEAALEFLRWTHVNGVVIDGLVRRRLAEKELFLGEFDA